MLCGHLSNRWALVIIITNKYNIIRVQWVYFKKTLKSLNSVLYVCSVYCSSRLVIAASMRWHCWVTTVMGSGRRTMNREDWRRLTRGSRCCYLLTTFSSLPVSHQLMRQAPVRWDIDDWLTRQAPFRWETDDWTACYWLMRPAPVRWDIAWLANKTSTIQVRN